MTDKTGPRKNLALGLERFLVPQRLGTVHRVSSYIAKCKVSGCFWKSNIWAEDEASAWNQLNEHFQRLHSDLVPEQVNL